ncbi:peptidylprolyl isomerase [Lichenihabitans psoromatis]|uniref:peptidylprolyl isomerase n=1 Tax=Lichenihabitans psoromatis TaxID=2528642 RepID=UPI0010384B7F|nr:peptidylprolyl isomerase [Lichenihabitans psoromatis]
MRVRLKSTLLAGAALALLLGATVAEAKVLAKVNGVEITDEDVRIATQDLGATLPQQLKGAARDTYVLDYLIDLKLAAAQGMKDGAADTPAFKQQMDYYRDKTLMESVLTNVAKTAATDAAERKVYEDVAKQQKPEVEIHARHILVPTEAEAKAALARVKGGEDFAKVADEVSKDPGSQGGDLGWFTRDKMVPEFADAAFKLEKGQISDPVKSEFGWHIIKLEDKRDKAFPPFDAVKDQVARYVVQKAQSDTIMKLRDAAKIERMEPVAPPTPAMPAAPVPATPDVAAPKP